MRNRRINNNENAQIIIVKMLQKLNQIKKKQPEKLKKKNLASFFPC